MLSSKAFIDYSTSGLENPLTHLLLLVFVWRWWDEPAGPLRLARLSLIASLCLLNRPDLLFLLAPALAYETWRLGSGSSVKPLLLGFAPLIAWELFSLFYYGSPFPNTALAKLNINVSAVGKVSRGVDYALRTLTADPATFPTMLLGIYAIPSTRLWRDWPLVAGIALHLLYVVGIGGDFMMGRFFTPSFVMALAFLARAGWATSVPIALVTIVTMLFMGLLAPWEPALVSGYGYSEINNALHGRHTATPLDDWRYIAHRGIIDERREYFDYTGLFTARRGLTLPDYEWARDGARLRTAGHQVVVRRTIGLTGYFAGPQVHIVDAYALSDPLLARIPGGTSTSITGHFLRELPDGYIETLQTGSNRLADADLAAYYQRLHMIISDPLWSVRRLLTLSRFLAGQYDHYLASFIARRPSPATDQGVGGGD
jgi:arabinofuranosyltransferase